MYMFYSSLLVCLYFCNSWINELLC